MWMQDGCKVYMDSYMVSNESCFMVTWIILKNPPLEVGLTQNQETKALRTFSSIDLFYSIMCEVLAWKEFHLISIWVRALSHMTSHYTWGSAITLYDVGGVLGRPLDTFFWALTISWSRLLARVWSGPKDPWNSSKDWVVGTRNPIWPLTVPQAYCKSGRGPCWETTSFRFPPWQYKNIYRNQWQFSWLPWPLVLHYTHFFFMGLMQYLVDRESIPKYQHWKFVRELTLHLILCRHCYPSFGGISKATNWNRINFVSWYELQAFPYITNL